MVVLMVWCWCRCGDEFIQERVRGGDDDADYVVLVYRDDNASKKGRG